MNAPEMQKAPHGVPYAFKQARLTALNPSS
jgi:hypothetical protein